MKRCFVYHRVSSDQQTDGSGMQRQADLLDSYLIRTGLCSEMDDPEPIILADGGISAFKGHNLTHGELGQWMEQVRKGMWDDSVLVVENIDRFSRQNPFTVVPWISELIEHGVSIHDVNANMIISYQNSMLLSMVTMNAQRAYDESKYKSIRIRAGWKARRENALKNGSVVTHKRPAWIDVVDDKYVLNDKALIVREIFRLYQTGIGCPTIAKLLQDKGTEWRMSPGRKWRGEAVHKILKNERVTGTIFISESVRNFEKSGDPITPKTSKADVYPVIISKEEFELVGKLLSSRRPGNGRIQGGTFTKKYYDFHGKPYRDREGNVIELEVNTGKEIKKSNIFGGMFRCGMCGEPMYHNVVVSKRKSVKRGEFTEEYRYIRCLGERDKLCDNKSLKYDIIEKYLVEHIKGMDFSQIIKPNEANPEVELVRIQIEEERRHIEDYERGINKRRAEGKKVSFDILSELEDAIARLDELEKSALVFEEINVNTDVLASVSTDELYDVSNVEVRSRVEREIGKIVDVIMLYRYGDAYILEISYKSLGVLKHVLMIKGTAMVSQVRIERTGDDMAYYTPSFGILVKSDGLIETYTGEEPISLIDYSMLLNYADASESDILAIWLRNNLNFLFNR
ncbi:recombinase family protein [Erwinia sp. JH02]|uniref:recombinase family protein n=1 Tax=Erwinia sp. JH02 TaxID=2733394 RepID=UPI001489493B|nr:recombinase family protein [Erwinia sp. JH02]NNS06228.1 recombinase family protein [Erwinia sp. JH02]